MKPKLRRLWLAFDAAGEPYAVGKTKQKCKDVAFFASGRNSWPVLEEYYGWEIRRVIVTEAPKQRKGRKR